MAKLKLIFLFAALFVGCFGDRTSFWNTFTTTQPYQPTSPCDTRLYKTIPAWCLNQTNTVAVKHRGYEYSSHTGHWYKFHSNPVISWSDARQACENQGARLAVPNSLEEAKVIMTLHARHTDAEIGNTDWPEWVSIGVYWDYDNSVWMTVDGQRLDQAGYTKWWKEPPPSPNRFPYIVMNRGGQYSSTKTVLYPYVCEKENVQADVTVIFH